MNTEQTSKNIFMYNAVFLNKKLHNLGSKLFPLCSCCNSYDETPFHILYEFGHAKCLCLELSIILKIV